MYLKEKVKVYYNILQVAPLVQQYFNFFLGQAPRLPSHLLYTLTLNII